MIFDKARGARVQGQPERKCWLFMDDPVKPGHDEKIIW